MQGALKQHKPETTQRWSHVSGIRRGAASNPMHASLAVTAIMATNSHMVISQARITWFLTYSHGDRGSPMSTWVPPSLSGSVVLYPGCVSESPGDLLRILMPGVLPREMVFFTRSPGGPNVQHWLRTMGVAPTLLQRGGVVWPWTSWI